MRFSAEPLRVVWKTDRGAWHQQRTRRSAPEGVEVRILRNPTTDTLRDALADADVLVSERSVAVEPWELDAGPNVRLLLRLGTIPDRLPIEEAVRRGVAVSLEPVPLCAVCAEHALMLALALLRDLPGTAFSFDGSMDYGTARRTNEDTFAFNWTKRTNLGTIRGSRIGILGMGGIGVELALRLRAFSPSAVRYSKRSRLASAIEETLGAVWADADAIVRDSDVLFCLLPYGAETDGWLGRERVAAMQQGAFLITVGSGSVVDEGAVLDAVAEGKLGGAAFDTFEWEPLPADHPLAAASRDPVSRILLSPHVAALGGPADAPDGWDEVRRWMSGAALGHRIA